jgi:hypothetical protein
VGLLRLLLAAVLLASAVAKLRAGARARHALQSYGVPLGWARGALWAGVIAAEAGLGAACLLYHLTLPTKLEV